MHTTKLRNAQPRTKPSYTLDELLARCSRRAARPDKEDRAWLDLPPVGRELRSAATSVSSGKKLVVS
jgi:hypothetical protein